MHIFSALLLFCGRAHLSVRLFAYLVVGCCIQTSATDPYRDTWLKPEVAVTNPEDIVSFHRDCAKLVAKAHRFCSDKSSNVAAFAICLHKGDGSVLASAVLPYVVSSGDQKSGGTSGVSTILVKEMFLKSYDGLSPLQAEINFVNFIKTKNGWNDLDEIKFVLERRLRNTEVLDIPDLSFSSNSSDQEKDKLLGSILHCEQAVLVKSMLSDQFLFNWISNLSPVDFGSPSDLSFLSFNIITYNDMCPKCFSTCFVCREELEQRVNQVLRKVVQQRWPETDVPLKVFVSSFRPYVVGTGGHTRICQVCKEKTKTCTEYCKFHDHVPPVQYGVSDFSANMLQFFNPWMASYVVGFEIVDFVDSALAGKITVRDAEKSLDCSDLLGRLQIANDRSISALGLIEDAQKKVQEYKAKLRDIQQKIAEKLAAIEDAEV